MNLTDCVALLALIFSFVSYCLSRREAQKQRDEMRRQGDAAQISVQLQYYAQLRSWADQAVDLLSEAAFLAICSPTLMPEAPNDFFTKRGEMMAALSALGDRGRWFLPNNNPEKHGREKPEAYQGFRQEALDCLMEAYKLLGRFNIKTGAGNTDLRQPLVDVKRAFVSEIQKVLEPRETRNILELPPRRRPG